MSKTHNNNLNYLLIDYVQCLSERVLIMLRKDNQKDLNVIINIYEKIFMLANISEKGVIGTDKNKYIAVNATKIFTLVEELILYIELLKNSDEIRYSFIKENIGRISEILTLLDNPSEASITDKIRQWVSRNFNTILIECLRLAFLG